MRFNTIDVFELKPGAKIDMRYLQTVSKKGRGDDEDHFVSGIHDIEEDGTLELDMPMQGGKVVLVPMGIRYEFIFTMDRRLYKAEADIVGRFRKDGFSLLKAKLTSDIEKFQRREYYRLDLLLPLDYVSLDERAGQLQSMSEIRQLMDGRDGAPIIGSGTIVNISGGGLRFTTKDDLDEAPFLFLRFGIEVGGEQRLVVLIGEILHDKEKEKKEEKMHSYRVRMHYKDTKSQEQIIRFIFEQERKMRKKELGE